MQLSNLDIKIIKNYDLYIQDNNRIPNETSLARRMGMEHSQIRYRMKLLDEEGIFISATRDNRVLLPGANYINAWRGCYTESKRKAWPKRKSCLIALVLHGKQDKKNVKQSSKPYTKKKSTREKVQASVTFQADGMMY